MALPNFNIENECGGLVVGIDEAGRGPLCGPVVAACCLLKDRQNYPQGLNDSKKLSAKKRGEILAQLQNVAIFAIGEVGVEIIDKINILNATKLAMKMAFENFCAQHVANPDVALVDGNFVPEINCSARAIIKGDAKSLSIAAASVVAKEHRDKVMANLHEELPQYCWAQNKGYGTKAHYEAIEKFGVSKHHRRSFRLY